MFCYKCGTKLPDGAMFCHKCGAQMMPGKEVQMTSEEDVVHNTAEQLSREKMLGGSEDDPFHNMQNLEIVRVDVERNLLLVKGAMPGPKKGLVYVKSAVKSAAQE